MTLRSQGQGKKEFHQAPILCFALHPSQPVVISGDESGVVYVSQFITGEIHGIVGTHSDNVESIVISPTQQIAASAGIDNKIFIYDLNTYAIRLTVNIGVYGGFTKLTFSNQDENTLIAGSTLGDISLIDPRNGQITKTIKGHIAPVNDYKEVSLFGERMLVTAGDDNQCMVFRMDQN